MNTKQAEELTGISRQNIRYYERMGLLTPIRGKENSYRDYSKEDIEVLKLIKMLRMLDMPLEDIAGIIHGDTTMKEGIEAQRQRLSQQRKQLGAAIEICDRMKKENVFPISVDKYLKEMEYEEKRTGGFAQFRSDYIQVAKAQDQKQFSFVVNRPIYNDRELMEVMRDYGEEQQIAIEQVKGKKPFTLKINGILYEASGMRIHRNVQDPVLSTVVVCTMCHPETAKDAVIPPCRRKIMQFVYRVLRNIQRQKWKSILNILVCTVAVCFAAFYVGSVESNKKQLQELPDTFHITGQVWNLSGRYNSGLLIWEKRADAIKNSRYISDYKENVELIAQSPKLQTTNEIEQIQVKGINSLRAANEIQKPEVIWQEGMDEKLFLGEDSGCIISEEFMKKNGLKIGDQLELYISSYHLASPDDRNLSLKELTKAQVTIVGSAKLEINSLLVSLETAKKWFEESGEVYQASHVAFVVSEPMELNALKRELEKAGFLNVISKANTNYKGEALVIDDILFIQSAENLRKSIRFLSSFYPFIFGLIFLVGYMVSYLLLQNRRIELAIMRTLGAEKGKIIVQIFCEHFLMAVAGSICGCLAAALLQLGNAETIVKVVGGFLIFYGAGAFISLHMISRFSVSAVLSGKE